MSNRPRGTPGHSSHAAIDDETGVGSLDGNDAWLGRTGPNAVLPPVPERDGLEMSREKIWSDNGPAAKASRAVSVLQADPDLAPGLAGERRREARRRSAARLWDVAAGGRLDRGETAAAAAAESGFGLLVLDGALCRHVAQGKRTGAELVGPGDLIRPWERFEDWATAPVVCTWTVLRPARLAILDRSFAHRVAAFPEVAIGLNQRSLQRTARLAAMLSSLCQPRVEDRLTTLFGHLGDRFGRREPDRIHIPLPLTHRVIGELIAASRPTVSKALMALREEGVLRRENGGWSLCEVAVEPALSQPPASAASGTGDRPAGS